MAGEDLACFDGARIFYLRDYGFPPADTYQVSEDASGGIWIGGESGIYRFAKGRFEKVDNEVAANIFPVSPALVVAAVGPAGKGLPQNATLVRIRKIGNAWKRDTVMNLESPGAFTLDSSGMILYPWPSNGWNEIRLDDIVRWRPGLPVPVQRHAVPRTPGNGGLKVMRDRTGCLWFGASGGNAYDCGKGAFAAPRPGADMNATMREADDGTMVLSGFSTVAVGRPGSFQVATRANGLPGITEAIKTRDGTAWLATNSGLYRFPSPFRIEYWTIREGLSDPPWSVARLGDRIFAALTPQVVVLSRDRLRWEPFAEFKAAGHVYGVLGAARWNSPGSARSGRRGGTRSEWKNRRADRTGSPDLLFDAADTERGRSRLARRPLARTYLPQREPAGVGRASAANPTIFECPWREV